MSAPLKATALSGYAERVIADAGFGSFSSEPSRGSLRVELFTAPPKTSAKRLRENRRTPNALDARIQETSDAVFKKSKSGPKSKRERDASEVPPEVKKRAKSSGEDDDLDDLVTEIGRMDIDALQWVDLPSRVARPAAPERFEGPLSASGTFLWNTLDLEPREWFIVFGRYELPLAFECAGNSENWYLEVFSRICYVRTDPLFRSRIEFSVLPTGSKNPKRLPPGRYSLSMTWEVTPIDPNLKHVENRWELSCAREIAPLGLTRKVWP